MVRPCFYLEGRVSRELLDGLDVGCEIKRGIKDNSKAFHLSNHKEGAVINSKGEAGFEEGHKELV